MKKRSASLAGCLMGMAAMAAPNPTSPVTFSRDVLPILQQHCQGCHRPGEVAPLSLLTYADARPWAKAIKAAVLTRKMPPWFADPQYGHFSNDRRLTEAQIGTLVAWVNQGALEGDKKDAPPPVVFQNGWNIKPDIVVEMPTPFPVPASGAINYKYVLVKTNFPSDLWIEAAEMRPGNPKVLHHGKVWVRPPGSRWMEKAAPGEAYDYETQRDTMGRNQMAQGNDILGKFNPGLGAQRFDVEGAAKLVPKGSDLVFELHYTTVGQPTTDVSKLGLVLAKHHPVARYFLSTGPAALNLVIPPQESNVEVVSEATVGTGIKLAYVQPHMHLRGKDYELRLVYPTGESETVFKGKFDFEWQLGYTFAKPIALPKGTRIIGISHFDNSPNNQYNPDPAREVRWGPQNWNEMSNAFIGLIFDAKIAPESVLHPSGPSLRGRFWPSLGLHWLTGGN